MGGGVEKRRLGVKRDDRRTSHPRAEGSNILAQVYTLDALSEVEVDGSEYKTTRVMVVGGCVGLGWVCARDFVRVALEDAPEGVAKRDDGVVREKKSV